MLGRSARRHNIALIMTELATLIRLMNVMLGPGPNFRKIFSIMTDLIVSFFYRNNMMLSPQKEPVSLDFKRIFSSLSKIFRGP